MSDSENDGCSLRRDVSRILRVGQFEGRRTRIRETYEGNSRFVRAAVTGCSMHPIHDRCDAIAANRKSHDKYGPFVGCTTRRVFYVKTHCCHDTMFAIRHATRPAVPCTKNVPRQLLLRAIRERSFKIINRPIILFVSERRFLPVVNDVENRNRETARRTRYSLRVESVVALGTDETAFPG